MIIKNAYLREQPSLFKPISFDVITFDLHQIRCNVHAPNKTSKKIRRIAFSVITVHEDYIVGPFFSDISGPHSFNSKKFQRQLFKWRLKLARISIIIRCQNLN